MKTGAIEVSQQYSSRINVLEVSIPAMVHLIHVLVGNDFKRHVHVSMMDEVGHQTRGANIGTNLAFGQVEAFHEPSPLENEAANAPFDTNAITGVHLIVGVDCIHSFTLA